MVAKMIKKKDMEYRMREETTRTIAQLDKTRLLLVKNAAEVLLMQQKMTEKEE